MAKITKYITYETNSYSSFKRINGNRDLSENNVKGIIKNIKEHGLKPTIIIVNEKMEIIDGQHRVEALKRLGLPILFQVHKGLGLEDCIAMNTQVLKWNSNDYVESYAELGNKEYMELQRLANLFPNFSRNNIVAIINNQSTNGVSSVLKNGTLKLKHKDKKAEVKLQFITDLMTKGLTNISGRKDSVYTTLARVMELPIIDCVRLEEQVIKYGYLMTDVVDIKNCLNKLEDIYNYRRVNKVRFYSQYFEI